MIYDHPFQPQDHIQPCPDSDINIQHQVLVLHKAPVQFSEDEPRF